MENLNKVIVKATNEVKNINKALGNMMNGKAANTKNPTVNNIVNKGGVNAVEKLVNIVNSNVKKVNAKISEEAKNIANQNNALLTAMKNREEYNKSIGHTNFGNKHV